MEEIIARSNVYALLSRVLLQELDSEKLEFFCTDETILEFLPHWRDWEFRNLERQKLLEEYLNPDFANLSLLHLIPYETFYTRADQMIETGGANPVTDFYSRYDFIVDYGVARVVSADHIGIEMEFMHHLCEAQLKAFRESDKEASDELIRVQYEFLNTHLLKWAPMYLINMKYEARTPLYYDTAEMALEFILSDNETLSVLVKA
ncbi:molecular chaperone TorD family protein [Sulfuricurvum sp.]|uniref:TorD/DmsD family molecular chaperone n=1 Tax=Sulfuricurvum sp. TaxID=2025608 RepID=UPI001983446A|nr:molecular chaperone TorD family protein [Sulfuricurvum sp.]MBD3799115.1 molecular chaperone TorD family protein [Campylobacterota bacterium]MBD3807037.1 molecular chaperone TorD family protein [Sulfuricurvum sp.]